MIHMFFDNGAGHQRACEADIIDLSIPSVIGFEGEDGRGLPEPCVECQEAIHDAQALAGDYDARRKTL